MSRPPKYETVDQIDIGLLALDTDAAGKNALLDEYNISSATLSRYAQKAWRLGPPNDVQKLDLVERPSKRYCDLRGVPVVYFAQDSHDQRIKIGASVELRGRIAFLEDRNKIALAVLGIEIYRTQNEAYAFEKQRHEQFFLENIEGEWFYPAMELFEHIIGKTYKLVEC